MNEARRVQLEVFRSRPPEERLRRGLELMLSDVDDIEVVAQAASGEEAVELAAQATPDVVLMDLRMPGLDGIEATRLLAGRDVAEPLAVVVITTYYHDEYVHAALQAGARGFLLKDAGPALLAQAVHAAADGEALIAPSVTARLLATFAAARGSRAAEPREPLTEREEQVVRAVARGRTNAEIAGDLHISLSTVKTHVASLMLKLSARNRVEVAMWAYESGRCGDA